MNSSEQHNLTKVAAWIIPLGLGITGGAVADRIAIERSTVQESTKIEAMERTVVQFQLDRDRYVTMAQFLEFGKRMDTVAADLREIKRVLMEQRR